MWVFGVGFLSTVFFLLIFAPFTMRRIENQAITEHPQYRKPLDFGGGSVIFYAYAILFPEHIALRIDRLLDVRTIRSYATNTDWMLALFVVVSSHVWIIATVVCFFIQ